jgi:hypothetical protein
MQLHFTSQDYPKRDYNGELDDIIREFENSIIKQIEDFDNSYKVISFFNKKEFNVVINLSETVF